MRLLPVVLLALLAAFSSAAALRAADPADAEIDEIMAKFEAAFVAGDMLYAIEQMYGPVLEAVGGKETALREAKAVQAQMEKNKLKFISWKTKKPYQYGSTPTRRYAVIPYEGVIDVGGGKKMRQTGYQLGIKDGDGPWKFVNGDNLFPPIYAKFFPDFPATLTPPKMQSAIE